MFVVNLYVLQYFGHIQQIYILHTHDYDESNILEKL